MGRKRLNPGKSHGIIIIICKQLSLCNTLCTWIGWNEYHNKVVTRDNPIKDRRLIPPA